jgi:hypothetical protein
LMLYLGFSVPAEFCWWVTSLHWTEYVWSSRGQCLKGHQVLWKMKRTRLSMMHQFHWVTSTCAN